MSIYDPPELDPGQMYTADFHARCHLSGLSAAFADNNAAVDPDPELCHGDTYPEQFARLVRGWNRCLDAAGLIHNRHTHDWNHGGSMTVIAADVRAAALTALEGVWNSLVANYLAETLDANRAAFDCPFCGVAAPTAIDGRCPACMCILCINDSETDWSLDA